MAHVQRSGSSVPLNLRIIGVITVGILLLIPLLAINVPILLTLLTVAMYFAIVSSNWNLLFGHAGVWSLGQLGFFAIGAYTSAILSKLGISTWLGILIGLAISLPVSFAISLVALRLRAVYFALATLAFQQVVLGFVIVINPSQIFDIPPLSIGNFSFASDGGLGYYYFFLLLLMVSTGTHRLLLSSRFGLAVVALRESEKRAISLGVDPVRVRSVMFLVSVAFTSLAGSVYAHYSASISQSILGFDLFLQYFIILAFGGIGTFYGPAISSFMLGGLDFVLRLYAESYRLVIMGGIVIISLLFLRRGVVELYERIVATLTLGRRRKPKRATTEP